ncbi:Uncharacterised protein [BD1-7 clade bacterium]|uniref:Uncharacterized protein n=1 Tax=BD1-7 clade bacterium TaxID=2029982 RepID=A0A5S9QJI8_9GAMM|nr:Uncharacterised protein [BD1-7 clade bacterium]
MLWGRLCPVREISDSELSFEELVKRNQLLNGIGCGLCFAGISIPLALFDHVPEKVHWWLVSLGFGFMVILPFLFISLVTLSKGLARFYEFWRFYELHYKIGIKGIMAVYIPLMMLGLLSIYQITKYI